MRKILILFALLAIACQKDDDVMEPPTVVVEPPPPPTPEPVPDTISPGTYVEVEYRWQYLNSREWTEWSPGHNGHRYIINTDGYVERSSYDHHIDEYTTSLNGLFERRVFETDPTDGVTRTIEIYSANQLFLTESEEYDGNIYTLQRKIRKISDSMELPRTYIYDERDITNEELIAIYIERGRGFYSDPIYGAIDQSSHESYFNAFIADARRRGLELDHQLENFNFQVTTEGALAWGQGTCDGSSFHIGVRDYYWNNEVQHDINAGRLWLMWHEFGHAILNEGHLCQRGHIMTGRHQSPEVVFDNSECAEDGADGHGHWNGYSLNWGGLNSNENVDSSEYDWNRAADDLFGNVWEHDWCPDNKGGSKRYDDFNIIKQHENTIPMR